MSDLFTREEIERDTAELTVENTLIEDAALILADEFGNTPFMRECMEAEIIGGFSHSATVRQEG